MKSKNTKQTSEYQHRLRNDASARGDNKITDKLNRQWIRNIRRKRVFESPEIRPNDPKRNTEI